MKDGLYCLTEIQIFYKNSSFEITTAQEFDEFLHNLLEISQYCYELIEKDQEFQSSTTLIFELIPSIIQILSCFKGQIKTISHGNGNESSRYQKGPQLLLDCFFGIKWPQFYVVFLSNIVTEIWEYLSNRHKVVLKVLIFFNFLLLLLSSSFSSPPPLLLLMIPLLSSCLSHFFRRKF